MASRLSLIRTAVRPKMYARALFKGPQGSGKTWTSLSVATQLAARHPDNPGTVTLLDTERESSLTYADVFAFEHLPWLPPYDPRELTATLDEFDRRLDHDNNDVLVIDSMSHFWRGEGGTLDIAGGRVQGGWDTARPAQEKLVQQIVAMRCHVILCARMKNTVLVSDNGKTIESVGLDIIQDDTLEYELNVAIQFDMQHRGTVTKSRTMAVPVGRTYPAGSEKQLSEQYGEWLDGGIPPASRSDVDAIVGAFAQITDKDRLIAVKHEYVQAFGMPHALIADRADEARQWLRDHGLVPTDEQATTQPPATPTQEPPAAPSAPPPPDAPAEPTEAPSEPQGPLPLDEVEPLVQAILARDPDPDPVETLRGYSVADLQAYLSTLPPAAEPQPEPEPVTEPEPTPPASGTLTVGEVEKMVGRELAKALGERGLKVGGTVADMRARLVEALA